MMETVYFSVEKVLGGYIVSGTDLNDGYNQVLTSLSKVLKLAKEHLADKDDTIVTVTE